MWHTLKVHGGEMPGRWPRQRHSAKKLTEIFEQPSRAILVGACLLALHAVLELIHSNTVGENVGRYLPDRC